LRKAEIAAVSKFFCVETRTRKTEARYAAEKRRGISEKPLAQGLDAPPAGSRRFIGK
jgi:hypothetical protein